MDLSDSAGYVCAFVGALAHGSYGVPVKATKDVDVHPLILQTYKTLVLAFMSCVVIPIFLMLSRNDNTEATVRFTPFGILSGFLWVSGGACGIYGIRKAGMAIAVGTWASLMVCVNFTWGILIFREPVHSFLQSCMAFGLLLVGLVGMSKYSAANKASSKASPKKMSRLEETIREDETHNYSSGSIEMENDTSASSTWDLEVRGASDSSVSKSATTTTTTATTATTTTTTTITSSARRLANRGTSTSSYPNGGSNSNMIVEKDHDDEDDKGGDEDTSLTTSLLKKMNAVVYGDEIPTDHDDKKRAFHIMNPVAIWYRFMAMIPSAVASLTPRQAGICMAAVNGIFGGCALVPLHYAKKQGFQGLTYIPSFGLGSFIANIVLWSLYFAGTYYQQQRQKQLRSPSRPENESTSTWKASVELMPCFYWSILWKRGILAGFLLSIGMICSILATGALGQGVGNSLVQLKILISGLWGIFYYKEIQNKRSIKLWFLSASICVSGILGLSYQRLMATHDAAVASALSRAAAAAALEASVAPTEGVFTTPLASAVVDTPAADFPKIQVGEVSEPIFIAGHN